MASSSSRMKRFDMFTRATTTPGTSPSSTSWSIRANVSFSDYEFAITFARIDHEVEEGDIPGVVVARVNMSTRFMKELLDAMQDSWSKWSSREGIRNLPEAPENNT